MKERNPLSDSKWDGTSVEIPDDYVLLDDWELLHTHGKSYLFGNGWPENSVSFKKVWLPVSQVIIDSDDQVYCAEWLAIKEEMI